MILLGSYWQIHNIGLRLGVRLSVWCGEKSRVQLGLMLVRDDKVRTKWNGKRKREKGY